MGHLGGVGLTELEERVYEELAGRSSATVQELAVALGLPVRRLRAVLAELAERGLVSGVSDGPARFVVAPPDQAIDALALGVENALARARVRAAELARRARAAAEHLNPSELVEVVEGAAAIASRIEQIQRAARHEVRMFDRPPFLNIANPVEVDRLAAGVRYRVVYERSLLDDPLHLERITTILRDGEHARALRDLPLKLMIVDDDAAIVPLVSAHDERPPAAMLVRPSVLLDSLAAMFEALWDRSVPLRAGLDPAELAEVDPDVAETLRLLATGMKDEVLARHLGVNVRTVRRRVRAALDALGVENRFQAGLRAAALGVLDDAPADHP